MYEKVNAKFPHLSYDDQRNIAIFALECEKAEMQRVYDAIYKHYWPTQSQSERELGF